MAIGQVVLRYWSAPHSCAGHKDHQAFGTAVLDLAPVSWQESGEKMAGEEMEELKTEFFLHKRQWHETKRYKTKHLEQALRKSRTIFGLKGLAINLDWRRVWWRSALISCGCCW